jgi:tripartite-type tricarboxylate transporter receptor subunit TctC
MTDSTSSLSRRSILGGLAAASAAGTLGVPALAQAKFPSRKFNVTIPTRQGGGAELLARAFDASWSKMLGQPFEYEFFPGAAGQVGYTLFVKKRAHDGHNLLFGNMGPEMIMYALQKPDYKFPDDYVYFCSLDVDDSCVFVRKESPFKRIEDVVAEARKRTLNVATSRIPHPASIGILALGDATKSRFNLVPYQGGNPTTTAVLNGEADIGVLPTAGVTRLRDRLTMLGVFNTKKNVLAAVSDNAPTINAVFNTKIPDLYSSRSWAVHADWADKNPAQMKILEESSAKVFSDQAFKNAFVKTGSPIEVLQYGDRKSCTEYALAMVELANKYRPILTAKGKGKKK